MGFDPRQRRADLLGDPPRNTEGDPPMIEQPDGSVPDEFTEANAQVDAEGNIPGLTIEADNRAIRAEKMFFLRSTTTSTVDTESDGEISTSVEHLARFAVEPGFVEDQTHDYGVQVFRPSWLEVTWVDGLLEKVRVTGHRVLKSGKVQQRSKQHPNVDISREKTWSTWSIHKTPFDRGQLPHNVERRIADYEMAVAVASASPAPGYHGPKKPPVTDTAAQV